MRLTEAIKDAPHFLRSFILFIIHPRNFVHERHGFVWTKHHWKGLAVWCIASVILMVKLYHVFLGPSLFGRIAHTLEEPSTITLTSAEKVPLTNLGLAYLASPTAKTNSYDNSRLPVLRKVSLFSSWGFALLTKTGFEAKLKSDGSVDKQSIEIWNNALGFECGFVEVWFENVTIEGLEIEKTLIFLISAYALVTTLSLFFPAKLLGGVGSLTDALKMGFLAYLFTLLYMTVSNLVISLIAFTMLNLSDEGPLWGVRTSIPFGYVERDQYLVGSIWFITILPLVRSYWIVFRELFSLTPKRFFAAFILSIVCSAIIVPIVFIPAIYVIVRFAKFWSAIL